MKTQKQMVEERIVALENERELVLLTSHGRSLEETERRVTGFNEALETAYSLLDCYEAAK